MSDVSTLVPVEQAPAPEKPEQKNDPFAGFSTEAFAGGEPIEEEAPVAAPALAPEPVNEEGGAEEAGDAPVPAPKKAQTAQERIDELTRARRQAEREAADLRKRLDEFQRTAERVVVVEQEPPKEAAKSAAAEGPPKAEEFEFGELDPAYIAAVVDYQAERKFAEFRERDAQERQQAAVRSRFEQQVLQGRERYPDFDDVVVKGAQEGTWPLSETLGVLLVQSEVGEDIAYHLASNPDEAMNVFRQAPVEQARFFGRLEAKFSAARAAATGDDAATPVTKKPPQAPPPVTPGRGAGGQFQATAASDDFLAFERSVNKAS